MFISSQAWAYNLLVDIDFTLVTKRLSHENITQYIFRTNKSIEEPNSLSSNTLAHRQKAKEILTLQHNVITLGTTYFHKNTCNWKVQWLFVTQFFSCSDTNKKNKKKIQLKCRNFNKNIHSQRLLPSVVHEDIADKLNKSAQRPYDKLTKELRKQRTTD